MDVELLTRFLTEERWGKVGVPRVTGNQTEGWHLGWYKWGPPGQAIKTIRRNGAVISDKWIRAYRSGIQRRTAPASRKDGTARSLSCNEIEFPVAQECQRLPMVISKAPKAAPSPEECLWTRLNHQTSNYTNFIRERSLAQTWAILLISGKHF